MEPPSGDLGTIIGETAEAQAPDRLPIVEPTGRIIETQIVKVSERLRDTTLKVVDEDAEAVQASPPTSTPNQVGVEELQGMPELEEAEPEEVLREEPPVAIPPAEAAIDLEGMPELEDAGPEESIEEYLANIPLIRESLAQP